MPIQDAKPCDIVAFAAHPDDVELNCGGTLAVAAAHGWKAGVVDFTRGELGTRGTPEIRAAEAAAAAKALDLTCRINLALPDGRLRDTEEARELVVGVLRQMRPRVVLAPPLVDHHADHMAVAATVSRSLYLAGVAKHSEERPPWRPRALLHYAGSRITAPSLVVDITAVYEKRRKAILCYKSQFYQESSKELATRISHPGFLDAIDARARHYGSVIGASYGEAYTAPEPLPVTDLVALYDKEPWKHEE